MKRKFFASAAAVLLTLGFADSAAYASSCNAVINSTILDTGVVFGEKAVQVAPNHTVNIQVVDESGVPIDGIRATVQNSSGTDVAKFTRYESAPNTSSFTSLNSSGITNNSYSVNVWNACSSCFTSNTLHHVEQDDSSFEPWEEYISYLPDDVLTFTDAGTQVLRVKSYNPNIASDMSIPSNTYAIYIDGNWASKGRGYLGLTTNDTYKNYFDTANGLVPAMLGRTTSYMPMDPSAFTFDYKFGVVSEVGQYQTGYSLAVPPSLMSAGTEYIKCRVRMMDIYPQDDADYRSNFNGMLHDPEQNRYYNPAADTGTTSCILTITSGAVVSAPIPDSEGYIEFYLEKGSREYTVELNGISIEKTVNPDFSTTISYKWADDVRPCYGGQTDFVTIKGIDLPDTGTNLLNIPADSYTVKLSGVPDEYENPDSISINVADTAEIQYIQIVLKESCDMGDVNANDTIDITDATLILTHYAQTAAGLPSSLTEAQLSAGDTDRDSSITIADATAILKYYAEKAAGLEPAW